VPSIVKIAVEGGLCPLSSIRAGREGRKGRKGQVVAAAPRTAVITAANHQPQSKHHSEEFQL
jgi:hypothetical protein